MSIVVPAYCTREAVMTAPQVQETAQNIAQVDAAVSAAPTSIEGLLHRRFYPWTGTRYFDWPNFQYAAPWRLWLDGNELASVSAITVDNGATALTAGQYVLRRSDGIDEAPYDLIEILLSGSGALSSSTTHQRAVAITGVYIGCPLNTAPAGATAEALDDSETAVDVTDSAAIGVGHIIKIDSERMLVTDKTLLTTGQTLQTPVGAGSDEVAIVVTTGSAYTVGERIQLDSETMQILSIAGNTLTVQRAVGGSVLASHTGATIYAPRTLTVVRGALGTTAATHLTAAAITRHVIPPLVEQLAEAEAIVQLANKGAAYARTVGEGENARQVNGRALTDLRKDAMAAHYRMRTGGAI